MIGRAAALAVVLALSANGLLVSAAVPRDTGFQAGGREFRITNSAQVKRTRPSPDGNLPPELRIIRRLVQIVTPGSDGERGWNAAMRNWLKTGEGLAFPEGGFAGFEGPGSISIEIEVLAASPEIIVAELGVSEYFGGPHPQSQRRTMLWSMRLARPLTNSEVFADIGNRRLQALVRKNLDREGCEAPHLAEAKLTVAPDGVTFRFDPYELGGYPCGGDSLLSWSEAAPFLRQPLPFDRASLERPSAH